MGVDDVAVIGVGAADRDGEPDLVRQARLMSGSPARNEPLRREQVSPADRVKAIAACARRGARTNAGLVRCRQP